MLQPIDDLKRVLDAFRRGGGERKPAYLQVHLSWAESEADALHVAHDQWATNTFGGALAWELETPAQFDEAARFVRPEDVTRSVLVSSDLGRHATWLTELCDLGFDGLYLHQVGPDQERFVETFGARVLGEVGR